MKKLFLTITLISCFVLSVFAEDGHKISFKINGYDKTELVLGYHYGGKQLIKDTIRANANGAFIYEGAEALEGGLYLVLLMPENKYFEMLIDHNDQHFSVETSKDNLAGDLKFTNSSANKIFQEYSIYLRSKGKQAQELRKAKETASGAEADKVNEQLNNLDEEVKAFQETIIKKYPKSLTAAIIKASQQVEIPTELNGEDAKAKENRYRYYKDHYFDKLDLADDRLIRSPLLFNKVTSYFENLVYKFPDSINVEIDKIIGAASSNKKTYQYWVTHFLNKYAKESAEIVGMDAVYVHVALKYYCDDKAKTDWIDEEQREKICKNANEFAPILIGKKAPNVRFQKKNDEWMMLHEVKADYTVLYFWDPDCGHCKKSIPKAVEFFQGYASKGVKMVGVCNRRKDEKKMCWDAIEEREMKGWIHVTDPYLQGKSKYNVTSNPRIFVMDKDMKIISKGIGSDQLKEVLDFHLKKDAEEKGLQGK